MNKMPRTYAIKREPNKAYDIQLKANEEVAKRLGCEVDKPSKYLYSLREVSLDLEEDETIPVDEIDSKIKSRSSEPLIRRYYESVEDLQKDIKLMFEDICERKPSVFERDADEV